jgi:hypothetical protein
MPSRGRSVNAVGVRGRLLVLLAEISTGVPDAPSVWFAGWCGTATSARALLAVEKSAEVVLRAGLAVLLAGGGPVGPTPSGVRSQ